MKVTRAALIAWGVDPRVIDAAVKASPPAVAESRELVRDARSRAKVYLPPGPAGTWSVEVPGWRPTSLNVFLRMHWTARHRLGAKVAGILAIACLAAGVSKAERRRRVGLELRYPQGQTPLDEDNAYKLLLDALVACGALVDDRLRWVARDPYLISPGPKSAVFTITDT